MRIVKMYRIRNFMLYDFLVKSGWEANEGTKNIISYYDKVDFFSKNSKRIYRRNELFFCDRNELLLVAWVEKISMFKLRKKILKVNVNG